jgi:hypothetical protein
MMQGRFGFLAALACALALTATPADADEPVWLSRGAEQGQGVILPMSGRCFVITAAHVAGDGSSPVRVVDGARRSATARLLRADPGLDIAVLEVPDVRNAGRDLCSSKFHRIPVIHRTEALEVAPRAPTVWLDKVNSASGETSRHVMVLATSAPDNHLLLGPARGPGGDFEPSPGDSGSPVWIARSKMTAEQLFNRDGTPRHVSPESRLLLGLYVGRSQERSVIVSADRIRAFVLQALEPVASTLSIAPPSAAVAIKYRGPADRTGAMAAYVLDSGAVESLVLEMDLGRRETVVRSVTVRLGGGPPPGSVARLNTRLDVFTSAYQPGEAPPASWAREPCQITGNTEQLAVRCTFPSAKVVRGMRVQLGGHPSMLRGIEVETANP